MKLSFSNSVTTLLILLVALSCGVIGLTYQLQIDNYRSSKLAELKIFAAMAVGTLNSLSDDDPSEGALPKKLTHGFGQCFPNGQARILPVTREKQVPEPYAGVATPEQMEVWASAISGTPAARMIPGIPDDHLMAVAPIKDDNGRIIGILQIQVPYLFWNAAVLRPLWPVLTLGVFIFLLAIVSAILFQRGLLRSLRTLAEATQIFGMGNLDHQVRVPGKGEVARLCHGFNQMARQLKNSRESLMTRTEDLEESNAKLEVQICERRKAETALRESQESYQTMAETASDGLITINKEHHILFINPAMGKIFGFTEKEMMASGLSDLIPEGHEKDLPPHAHFNRAVRILGRHKSGTVIPLEISWGMSQSKGEENYIGIIRDVSERIHYEEELKIAKVLAEEATAAKSEFLANMSHEIRTPMNAVIGMASMLLDAGLTKSQKEYAITIHNSGESLLTLINNILDFSKMESGKMELEEVEFNLIELVEETLDMLGTRARENMLLLAYQCRPGTPVNLIGDPNRLRQILVNLINNALKFTHEGHVLLSIKAEEFDNDEFELHFIIEDSGIGIPPEMVESLFRSFHQVDASTTRKYGGTGLGLAISKSFCELMGGRIWVDSAVDKGSTFNFTIKTHQVPRSPACFLHSYHPELAKRNVLVQFESPILRRIVSDYVSWWGMEVSVFTTRDELAAAIDKTNPLDFVVTEASATEVDFVLETQRVMRKRHSELIVLTSLGSPFEDGLNLSVTHQPLKAVELFQLIFGETGNPLESSTFKLQSTSTFRLADVMPMSVLVAEDNFVNQKVAKEFLSRLGYEIDLANDGVEALNAVKESLYDVVFMDVHMPQMDGLEATKEIIANTPEERRPYVIAMTANAMPGDREMCLAAGMNDYVSKPVKLQSLRKVLENAWRDVGSLRAKNVPAKASRHKKAQAHTTEYTMPLQTGRIDFGTLNFFRKDDDETGGEVVRDLINLYFDTFEENFAKLRASVERGDHVSSVKLAHTIKGSSGNIGLSAVAKACKAFELAAKEDDPENLVTLLKDIESEAMDARRELDAYIASLPAPVD